MDAAPSALSTLLWCFCDMVRDFLAITLIFRLVVVACFTNIGSAEELNKYWAEDCYSVDIRKDGETYTVIKAQLQHQCRGVTYYSPAKLSSQGDNGVIRSNDGALIASFPTSFSDILGCQTTFVDGKMGGGCIHHSSGGIHIVVPAPVEMFSVELRRGTFPVFTFSVPQ